MLKAEADDSWDDDKDAEYENVYRHRYRHVSSTEFQEMNLKLPLIGLLVYGISLIAFTVDFLSEVTGSKFLSALPWILHEICTLMTLVGLCVGMYFIARSYRLAASNTRYLVKHWMQLGVRFRVELMVTSNNGG